MDIANILPNTRPTVDAYNTTQQSSAFPTKKSNTVEGQVQIPAVERVDLRSVDNKRLDDIQKTIEQPAFKEVYAVSDKTFTIFKDSSGQYITRYTSLRDGSVSYVPEPAILNFSGGSEHYFAVHA